MPLNPNPPPVIIIGGGPVGMALAMNLDALGMRSVIINTEPHPRWHPKGSTQNARTMEHYRRLGIASKLRKLGLPSHHKTDVIYTTRLTGWELARIRMPSEDEKMEAVRNALPTDQVPEPIFRCNQMHVEAFLFEHIRTLKTVDVRFGWHCHDYRQDDEGVSVDIEQVESGRTETLRGSYLAGCDGGQSMVRRKLGIRYGGGPAAEQAYLGGAMVSTHIRCPEFYGRIIREPRWQYWVVNAQIRGNIVAVNGKDEFLFNTRLASVSDQPDDNAIKRAFVAAVGEPIDVEIIGHWTWTAGMALVADKFVEGRVALCGDAVHLFTPAGGFGMNTGIDDAANLGWKLAAMAQGWGGPKLMESYEIERRPIALRNTNAAKALGRNIGAVPVDPAIEEQSPAGEEARRKAGEYLAGFEPEFASLGVQLGARYDGSTIIVSDGSDLPKDDLVNYVPSSVPGGRAPHLWLEDGTSLFDKFGSGFTLLRFKEGDSSALEAMLVKRGLPCKIVDVRLAAAADLYKSAFVLARPDQHIAWAGDDISADVEEIASIVTGY
jgi:2-polyprenyl-6-methoxyphenol hydroxylase-like FAD-dependent oxidoreductase